MKINSVGSRIASLRGKLGVSEFAEELGVNRKTVTRWESDETLPDGGSLLALKEKFGSDPGWVLTGAGEAPSTSSLTPDEHVLLDGYRALDPATKRRMLAFILTESGPAAVQNKIKEKVEEATQSQVTVTATGRGAQAAGHDLKNKQGKYRGAKIGGVVEGDLTGTTHIQVGGKGNR